MNDNTHNAKCKWKDGMYHSCTVINSSFYNAIMEVLNNGKSVLCPVCNESVSKPPEPSVIICKSGETWVAQSDGVDYLWMHKSPIKIEFYDKLNFELDLKAKLWKPISDIEITDKIAKLRPMVVCKCTCNSIFKLYGVSDEIKGYPYIGYDKDKQDYAGWVEVRLATVSDLEEQS